VSRARPRLSLPGVRLRQPEARHVSDCLRAAAPTCRWSRSAPRRAPHVVAPALRRRAARSRSKTSSSRPAIGCRRHRRARPRARRRRRARLPRAARREPGAGKCVTGDTRVLDPETGDYLPITALRDRRASVLSINENRCFFTHHPYRSFTSEASVRSLMSSRGWAEAALHAGPSSPH